MKEPAPGAKPAELEMVAAYRRHVVDLLFVLCLIGVAAQSVAAAMSGSPQRAALCVMVVSLAMILAAKWAQERTRPAVFAVLMVIAGCCVSQGLFYLNKGWDGSHLYPLLWTYSIISIVGLYGAWPFTLLTLAAGWVTAVLGKVFTPDMTFGVGADQSWGRVVTECFWWMMALGGSGITGRQVIRLATMAGAAQTAVLAAQAKEHTWYRGGRTLAPGRGH